MANHSVKLVALLFGLLIASVLGSSSDNGDWLAMGAFTLTGGIGSIVVVMIVLACLGFGPNGVVAGSFAALIQVPFTVAGGLFSILQSVGAGGSFSIKLAIGLTGAYYGYRAYLQYVNPSG